jgi:hypothetical protein
MTEVPLMPLWVTLFLTIWVPLGPLVGLAIGHYLSRSQQRKHWIADNAKEEYRELLGALYDAADISVMNRSMGRETNKEEDDQEEQSEHNLIGIIHTRLFINDFIAKRT